MQAAYIDFGAKRKAGIKEWRNKSGRGVGDGLLTALLAFVVAFQATVTLPGGGVFRM
jgi:hypothetical protein